jgi:hypothetical protein
MTDDLLLRAAKRRMAEDGLQQMKRSIAAVRRYRGFIQSRRHIR